MTSRFTWCLALGAALVAPAALGQPFTADKRLLLSEGVLRGSPRVMGIAGAFVSVAEGAEGITRNPAAAASRDPHFDSELAFDFGAALHFLPPWAVTEQDWDNDGRLDQPASANGPSRSFLGNQVVYLAGSFQWKAVGLGLGVDTQNFITKRTREADGYDTFFNLNLLHAFASLGLTVWRDQVLAGLGIESTDAFLIYGEQAPGARLPNRNLDSLGYHGFGFQFGALWRPEDQDYRIGFSYRPASVGLPTSQRDDIQGYVPFAAVVAPARVSVGASWALGSTGRHYNITGRSGWGEVPAKKPGDEVEYSPALTRWLITTQLDVYFPVQNATYSAAFLEQGSGLDALTAGDQVSFEPRLGIEKELVQDRLRMRLGGYLEPPLVPTAPPVRPHITFGGEIYLFKLGPSRICFGISFDWARLYGNLSFAFMVWK